MNTTLLRAAALATVFGLACSPVASEPTQEAKVANLLEKHRQALGGDARSNVGTLRLEGTYAYNGLDHPLVELRARPNHLHREIEGVQQYGVQKDARLVVRAHGASGAWTENEGEEGVAAMNASQASAFIDAADFDGSLFDAAEKGHQVSFVGEEELDGQAVVHLKVMLKNGHEEDWWLDTATYLPTRKAITSTDDILRPHTWYFDDWREVGGMQVPFYVMAEEAIFSREYLYETAEAGVEIGGGIFEQPSE